MTITGLLPPTAEYLPYTDNIAAGPVQSFYAHGVRLSVSAVTNGDDIWSGVATTIPIPPSIGEQMTVVSTSANDANGNTGINTVELRYIDANGDSQIETIIMAGLVPVNTTALNIRFVNDLYALSVGTAGGAVGTIIIYAFGAPATIYTQINPGHFKHANTARMVPAGKVCLIEQFDTSGGAAVGGKTTQVNLRTTSHRGLLLPVSPNPVFNKKSIIMIFNSGLTVKFDTPILVPALAVIKCTSFATGAGADIAASWYGKLVSAPI